MTLVVPAGWSAPSITSGNPGYTVSSTGTVSVAAQTITVSSVTLAAGATMTIVVRQRRARSNRAGSRGLRQPGRRSRRQSVAGALTNLGASPSITVAPSPSSARAFPASRDALRHRRPGQQAARAPASAAARPTIPAAGLQKVELAIRQGTGNYWNGSGVLERIAGVRPRHRYRDLVVRVPGVELPRRRRLHRADAAQPTI